MTFGGQHPHAPNEGATCEWYTPPHVFEALGLEFDLDPCAPALPAADWIPADRRYSLPDDGLTLPWHRHDRIWPNPPYGKQAGRWVERLAEHGNGIALVFSRTDVRWWHAAVPKATAVCFIRGRLTFIAGAGQSAPGNSGGPSALIAYGDDWGAPLIDPVRICGASVPGLRVIRHRLFESNFPIEAIPCPPKHPLVFTYDKRKAHYGKLDQDSSYVQVTGGGNCTVANKLDAMGIDWMTGAEVNEAIPPAYTRHVGSYLLAHLDYEQRAVA